MGVQEYITSDYITLKVTFIHAWHLNPERIHATFVYAGEETNHPGFTMKHIDWNTQAETGGQLRTTVELRSEDRVPPGVAPGGEYKLNSLLVESYGGQVFDLAAMDPRLERMRCRVRSGEPQEPPSVVGAVLE